MTRNDTPLTNCPIPVEEALKCDPSRHSLCVFFTQIIVSIPAGERGADPA